MYDHISVIAVDHIKSKETVGGFSVQNVSDLYGGLFYEYLFRCDYLLYGQLL